MGSGNTSGVIGNECIGGLDPHAPPSGKRNIKYKWVFLKKMSPDGTLNKYRARLEACGYGQVHAHNYFETFIPNVGLDNVRMLPALAVHYDWEVHQVEVKTAFLHAPLDEDVYMDVQEGVEFS